MVCLFLYIFLRRTLQRYHERGRATPATTGAFSCCWNYVRHLKLSRTAKFQGESSFLGSTAATKEEGAGAETTADPCLVAGCAGLRLFPRTHEGSWLLQWKPCGWAGVFRGKSGFRYAKRRVLTSQATSSRYVCLCVNLLVIIWGTCRDHALTMKKQFCSHVRGSSTPARRRARSLEVALVCIKKKREKRKKIDEQATVFLLLLVKPLNLIPRRGHWISKHPFWVISLPLLASSRKVWFS